MPDKKIPTPSELSSNFEDLFIMNQACQLIGMAHVRAALEILGNAIVDVQQSRTRSVDNSEELMRILPEKIQELMIELEDFHSGYAARIQQKIDQMLPRNLDEPPSPTTSE